MGTGEGGKGSHFFRCRLRGNTTVPRGSTPGTDFLYVLPVFMGNVRVRVEVVFGLDTKNLKICPPHQGKEHLVAGILVQSTAKLHGNEELARILDSGAIWDGHRIQIGH